MVGKPNDTVYKITSLPRWQREWINEHRAINYSGLVQKMLNNLIAELDPEYYKKFKGLEIKTRRMDNLEAVAYRQVCLQKAFANL